MRSPFFHRLAIFIVLFAVWCVLSGVHSLFFLILGAISSLLALIISVRMRVTDIEGHPLHLWLSAPFYWIWLLVEMVKSTLHVTRIIWRPALKISPRFEWKPLTQTNDLGRTIFANSITLTPGTVCIDITNRDVLVHALEARTLDHWQESEMDRRVTNLTRRPGDARA